jgi:hypothetical protein
MNSDFKSIGIFFQQIQHHLVVRSSDKNRLSVIAPLNDVVRKAR